MDVGSKIRCLIDAYDWTWTRIDHRVNDWFLMSSVKPILFFLFIYFLLVIYGPKLMCHRKPFEFYWTLIFYNILIAICNLHIFKELVYCTYIRNYDWFCEEVPNSTDPHEMRIVSALHWYFVSKLIEFLDTFFFVIRKKNAQLTFLHVYHHSTMFLIWWIIVRWVPGGSAVFGPLINTFVHVLMYTYYALSVFGPKMAKYLWWKRYLTIIQLVQFTVGLYFGANAIFIGCKFTKWLQYLLCGYMSSYLILFGNFYRLAYGTKKIKVKVTSFSGADNNKKAEPFSKFECYRRNIYSGASC